MTEYEFNNLKRGDFVISENVPHVIISDVFHQEPIPNKILKEYKFYRTEPFDKKQYKIWKFVLLSTCIHNFKLMTQDEINLLKVKML